MGRTGCSPPVNAPTTPGVASRRTAGLLRYFSLANGTRSEDVLQKAQVQAVKQVKRLPLLHASTGRGAVLRLGAPTSGLG